MATHAQRQVQLLRLTHPLQRYASGRGRDTNASFLLVHRALSAAFTEDDETRRPTAGLEDSLRADIDRLGRVPRHG